MLAQAWTHTLVISSIRKSGVEEIGLEKLEIFAQTSRKLRKEKQRDFQFFIDYWQKIRVQRTNEHSIVLLLPIFKPIFNSTN